MRDLKEVASLTLPWREAQYRGELRTSAFQRESDTYLKRHPYTQYIDILLTDLNGCFRAKRIPLAGLAKIENGCYFPASVYALNLYGQTVETAGLGQEKGEPDHICMPVADSLLP